MYQKIWLEWESRKFVNYKFIINIDKFLYFSKQLLALVMKGKKKKIIMHQIKQQKYYKH